ncbi:MAG TPA: DNA-processing protein DprA [Bacteroidales bacterium]|nr:DNA-processing protein DprA [Bacteroidales bacterium]
MNKEAAYWIALAQLPRWGHLKLNKLIINFYHENKLSIEDFFHLPENDWKNQYALEYKDIEDLKKAKSELANFAFLAETMLNEGYELIPITTPEYSKTLKENLKAAHAPALLYVKGNKQIMHEESIAIVGSRNAAAKSLEFTDNIAQLASKQYKVIVSGFAKGVDKQALDSAINYKGQSIIVLPQGIMTFGSGFQKYYKQIVAGDVLVLSTFFPKAPWSAELAMARNPIIYGLASEIYVAESSDKGGTWSGVVDGLRKNRLIYVRKPDSNENNANNLLIQKGAIAVDFNGNPLTLYLPPSTQINQLNLREPAVDYENKILELLKTGAYTSKDIIKKLQLNWSEKELRNYLKGKKEVETINKKPLQYTIVDATKRQKTLFD